MRQLHLEAAAGGAHCDGADEDEEDGAVRPLGERCPLDRAGGEAVCRRLGQHEQPARAVVLAAQDGAEHRLVRLEHGRQPRAHLLDVGADGLLALVELLLACLHTVDRLLDDIHRLLDALEHALCEGGLGEAQLGGGGARVGDGLVDGLADGPRDGHLEPPVLEQRELVLGVAGGGLPAHRAARTLEETHHLGHRERAELLWNGLVVLLVEGADALDHGIDWRRWHPLEDRPLVRKNLAVVASRVVDAVCGGARRARLEEVGRRVGRAVGVRAAHEDWEDGLAVLLVQQAREGQLEQQVVARALLRQHGEAAEGPPRDEGHEHARAGHAEEAGEVDGLADVQRVAVEEDGVLEGGRRVIDALDKGAVEDGAVRVGEEGGVPLERRGGAQPARETLFELEHGQRLSIHPDGLLAATEQFVEVDQHLGAG
mmetsp:Transcript_30199/g.64907  ORF Transcript_30199/g.64907 Transcript_30199/m.64907 type:complete len:428 (+) Transcript_30199:469-1752(+)